MAIIKEKIENIKKLNSIKKSLEGQREQTNDFKKRNEQLGKVVDDLKVLENIAGLFKKYHTPNLKEVNFGYVLNETKNLQKKYQNDPSAILEIGVGLFGKWNDSIKEAKDDLQENWATYKRERIFRIDDSLTNVLAALPSYKENVRLLKEKRETLHSLLNTSAPQSDEEWDRLLKTNDELHELWDKLDTKEFPPSVFQFIKEVHRGGVTLDRYTDEIKTWLESKNLTSNFIIKL